MSDYELNKINARLERLEEGIATTHALLRQLAGAPSVPRAEAQQIVNEAAAPGLDASLTPAPTNESTTAPAETGTETKPETAGNTETIGTQQVGKANPA